MRRWAVVAVVSRCVVVLLAVVAASGCAPKKVRRPPVVAVPRDPEWPRPEVLALAERAWRCGYQSGEFSSPLLTVIDYSLPSTERRFWVIDMLWHRVLEHEVVAHGEGSGGNEATSFSNAEGSWQSSLGLFRTENTYVGGQGYSLRLAGLEPGINDHALERRIVVHGADYADPAVIPLLGRLGRSHGCLALRPAVSPEVIDLIKGGSAVFAYYPDPQWLAESRFLRCEDVRTAQR